MVPERFAVLCRLLLLCAVLTGDAAFGGEPADSLLHLVGAESGLVLHLKNWKNHRLEIARSEMFQRLQSLTVWQRWRQGSDFRKLDQARQFVETVGGRPLSTVLDELAGESLVLAVVPRLDGKPQLTLLMRTAGEASRRDLLSLWDRLDPRPQTKHVHAGRQYVQRGRDPDSSLYHAILDDVMTVSEDVAAIRRVLDLAALSGPTSIPAESVAATILYAQLSEQLSPAALATVYVNPRAWDEQLRTGNRAEGNRAETDPGARLFLEGWQRCSALGASLRFAEGPVLELAVRYDGTGASEAWNEFVAQPSPAEPLLHNLPHSALLAVDGRNTLAAIVGVVLARIPPGQNPQWEELRRALCGLCLGFDPVDDVLPRLGAWTGWVIPRESDTAAPVPLDGVLRFSWPAAADSDVVTDRPQFAAALDNALGFGLNLLTVATNSRRADGLAVVRRSPVSQDPIRWCEGLGPYRPAYRMTPGSLTLATAPEWLAADPNPILAREIPEFASWSRDAFPEADQIWMLNVVGLRGFLAQHQEQFAAQLARGGDSETVTRRFERLNEFLRIADTVVLAGRIEDDRMRFVLGSRATAP